MGFQQEFSAIAMENAGHRHASSLSDGHMDMPKMVSATLGLSPPWHVSKVTIAEDGKRLDINVNYVADTTPACPHCGAQGVMCTADIETWYHHDFFRYATYLHSRVPRIACCGRIRAIERPWTRMGSKFVKIGELVSSE